MGEKTGKQIISTLDECIPELEALGVSTVVDKDKLFFIPSIANS
jgi:hypothetical protein